MLFCYVAFSSRYLAGYLKIWIILIIVYILVSFWAEICKQRWFIHFVYGACFKWKFIRIRWGTFSKRRVKSCGAKEGLVYLTAKKALWNILNKTRDFYCLWGRFFAAFRIVFICIYYRRTYVPKFYFSYQKTKKRLNGNFALHFGAKWQKYFSKMLKIFVISIDMRAFL